MNVYEDDDLTAKHYAMAEGRTHPWSVGSTDEAHRYVNFKRQPELIEDSLEDFVPHGRIAGVRRFFEFIRYVNREGGFLETSDSGCKPPSLNVARDGDWPDARFRGHGRVMLLYRNWWANTNEGYSESLMRSVGAGIQGHVTQARATIGLSFIPTFFPSLSEGIEGRQTVASWWIYGDTRADTWWALADVCAALTAGVDVIERLIREQLSRAAPATRERDHPGAAFSEPPPEAPTTRLK